MTVEMRRPSPRGKWEKALDSSQFWLLPIALIVGNVLRGVLGFWLSLLVVVVVMGAATFLLRLPATAERSRRLEIDARSGLIECAIRYPGALPGSLRAGWSAGVAEVGDGIIKFQTAFDLAGQRRGAVAVFGDLHPLGERALSDKRTLALRRANRVIAIGTDKGEIELAATTDSLKSVEEHFRDEGGRAIKIQF
jgi:hypothetical protein